MSEIRTLTMHCLASWAQAPRQWKPPRFSMPMVVSQVLANSRQTLFKLMSRPSSLGCPHGYLFRETGGRRPGRANIKIPWYPLCWHYTDIPTVAEFGKSTSTSLQRLGTDPARCLAEYVLPPRTSTSFGCIRG